MQIWVPDVREGVAEVVAVGDDVTGFQVGERVVVPFQRSLVDRALRRGSCRRPRRPRRLCRHRRRPAGRGGAARCDRARRRHQGAVELPMLEMYTRGVQFVTARVNARAVIPQVIDLLASGCDLAPVVDRVVPWDDAAQVWPTMTAKTVFIRD